MFQFLTQARSSRRKSAHTIVLYLGLIYIFSIGALGATSTPRASSTLSRTGNVFRPINLSPTTRGVFDPLKLSPTNFPNIAVVPLVPLNLGDYQESEVLNQRIRFAYHDDIFEQLSPACNVVDCNVGTSRSRSQFEGTSQQQQQHEEEEDSAPSLRRPSIERSTTSSSSQISSRSQASSTTGQPTPTRTFRNYQPRIVEPFVGYDPYRENYEHRWSVPYQDFAEDYFQSDRQRYWHLRAIGNDMHQPSIPVLYRIFYPSQQRIGGGDSAQAPRLPPETIQEIVNRATIRIGHVISPSLVFMMLTAPQHGTEAANRLDYVRTITGDAQDDLRAALNNVTYNAYSGDARILGLRDEYLLGFIRNVSLYDPPGALPVIEEWIDVFDDFRDQCSRQNVLWVAAANRGDSSIQAAYIPRVFIWDRMTFEEGVNLYDLLVSTMDQWQEVVDLVFGHEQLTATPRRYLDRLRPSDLLPFRVIFNAAIAPLGIALSDRRNFAQLRRNAAGSIPSFPEVALPSTRGG